MAIRHKQLSLTIKKAGILFLTTLLFMPTNAYAKKPSIFVITDDRIQIHQQISKQLKQSLSNTSDVRILHFQDTSYQQIIHDQPTLIITLGTRSSRLIPPSSTPTIYTLISKNKSKEISTCPPDNCSIKNNNSFFIYLDQPLSRQLKFLSLLLPNAKRLGVLTASFSENSLNRLKKISEKLGYSLKNKTINSPSDLSSQLNTLINDIDVLFTLPDPQIHNIHSISNLLLTTYRYNIPVLGFSKSYANAGAIAAIYSSPEQIHQQISDLARTILISPESISTTHFPPKYFSIAINKSVARSLELHLADEQLLKSQLLAIDE